MAGIISVENIGGIFSGVGDLAKKLREAITGKIPEKEAELMALIEQFDQQIKLGQIEINKIEAQSNNIFKSGWRPFLAWCCVLAFVLSCVVRPIILWIYAIKGDTIALPELDVGTAISILGGILGLGTLRTYEKTKLK